MADEELYLQLEELQAKYDSLVKIVQELIEREQDLSNLALPDDLDENAREAHELQQDERIAALEVGEPQDLTPEVLPELEGTAESPYEMLPATLEGAEAAQTDSWDRDNPPAGTDGVSIKITVREVYNDTGDQIIYGQYRTFTWDSAGLLKSIVTETRYTIDTPGACP